MAAPNVDMEKIWSASGQLQAAVDMINTSTNQAGRLNLYANGGSGRLPVFKTGTLGSGTGYSSAEIATGTGLPAAVVTDLITRTFNPRAL